VSSTILEQNGVEKEASQRGTITMCLNLGHFAFIPRIDLSCRWCHLYTPTSPRNTEKVVMGLGKVPYFPGHLTEGRDECK
jgi:hypothetical protein